jgi:hypothetical protein
MNLMGRGRFLVLGLAAALAVGLGAGCSSTKLEPGGAYAPVDISGNAIVKPDPAFYIVDAAYAVAYATVDGVFKFEADNRLFLWQVSPDFKHALDKLRPEALKVRDDYARCRLAYKANPVPANLTQLQAALAKVQQVTATAAALLPTVTTKQN